LHLFLADFSIRAFLLSDAKFDSAHIHILLEKEKQEIALLHLQGKISQLSLQEEKKEETKAAALQREKDAVSFKALVIHKSKTAESLLESKNYIPHEEEEINNILTVLKHVQNTKKLKNHAFRRIVIKKLSGIFEKGETDKLLEALEKEPKIRHFLVNFIKEQRRVWQQKHSGSESLSSSFSRMRPY
jgi:hypothetical protein